MESVAGAESGLAAGAGAVALPNVVVRAAEPDAVLSSQVTARLKVRAVMSEPLPESRAEPVQPGAKTRGETVRLSARQVGRRVAQPSEPSLDGAEPALAPLRALAEREGGAAERRGAVL